MLPTIVMPVIEFLPIYCRKTAERADNIYGYMKIMNIFNHTRDRKIHTVFNLNYLANRILVIENFQ